jgi:3-oxoacyl-[acyl-carrier protein] reductase
MGEQGAKVVVNYFGNVKAANEVVCAIEASGGSAIAVKADVSTVAGGQHLIDEAVKAFGRIDILVLNAGIMGSRLLADVDEAFYDEHFAANVKGPLFLAKAAAPLLPTRASNFSCLQRLALTSLFIQRAGASYSSPPALLSPRVRPVAFIFLYFF